jgi:deoxycytidine triphosphate deaminase
MAVFSNIQIARALEEGHIVCEPFNPKHVAHASLDVTLGYYYYRTERTGYHSVYNPFDETDVERYFDGPFKASSHQEWCNKHGMTLLKGIPADHPVIALKPGERILAHTHEFFGIKPPGAFELKSRSSWGRNGIAVCFDAGWVDPGYINRLTLEIYNLNMKDIVLLPVGERIAQAVFHETGEVEGNYGLGRDNGYSGKYQHGTNLKELIKNWSPEQMLPKAYLDTRILPTAVKGLSSYTGLKLD